MAVLLLLLERKGQLVSRELRFFIAFNQFGYKIPGSANKHLPGLQPFLYWPFVRK